MSFLWHLKLRNMTSKRWNMTLKKRKNFHIKHRKSVLLGFILNSSQSLLRKQEFHLYFCVRFPLFQMFHIKSVQKLQSSQIFCKKSQKTLNFSFFGVKIMKICKIWQKYDKNPKYDIWCQIWQIIWSSYSHKITGPSHLPMLYSVHYVKIGDFSCCHSKYRKLHNILERSGLATFS